MEPNREPSSAKVSTSDSSSHGEVFVEVLNVTRNTRIAIRAEVAGSGVKRSKGLLGRKGLDAGGGMWIVPCEAVHTFFMQFPLDLVYLDKKHRIRKVRSNVGPWRISACLSAHSIIELPVGAIRDSQSQPGDIVKIEPASGM
jgi:uncharacterized membrane protein (UPF0127 family)